MTDSDEPHCEAGKGETAVEWLMNKKGADLNWSLGYQESPPPTATAFPK